MRTKILLASAAALAAGVLASSAQVYSANIVGYVNTTFAGSGNYTLVATPLDNSGSNDLTSLLSNTLPNKSQVTVYNAASATFTVSSKISGVWNTNFTLNPGTGYFVKTPAASGPLTNTYVGNVLNSTFGYGQSNTVNLQAGFQLVGNPVPFSGQLSSSGPDSINLTLPNKSQVEIFDTPSQTYVIASLLSGTWNTNITLNVGQGFFINAHSVTNWVQTLQ